MERTENVEAHHDGAERDADRQLETMIVNAPVRSEFGKSTHRVIVVLDDVLVSGASFTAARVLLSLEFPNDEVIGVFWAKAEYAEG